MKIEEIAAKLPEMKISSIAQVVLANWPKVYFGAVPYLRAMLTLDDVSQDYGADSGRSIVIYFLGNAATWRGPVAKLVKAELKKRTK